MTPEAKEILKLRDDIKADLEDLFKKYVKISDWDIPEANDKEVATKVISVMQEELDKLKAEVFEGKFDNF